MEAISYSDIRAGFSKTMDKVVNNHNPVIITRRNRPPVVMLSLDDYEALNETAYLLRSPRNALRLMESIKQIESGGGSLKELSE
ncbi:MAG: type II toxin-antitoxin system prevent-host-death family antitoxin [bacterium]|nr:type II toxin-antitoxin system prevent-host-death family antitoxin [bacterium]